MLNFSTEDVEGGFKRIEELGADVVAEPYEPGGGMFMCTFADPDGNYFQLVTPWATEPASSQLGRDVVAPLLTWPARLAGRRPVGSIPG